MAEIVVTAQKREQRLQDVPISISVVSGKQLSDFQVNDIKGAMNLIPNVFVQSTAGNDVIYIRGFGSPPANFAFDQSVSLYVDGIYAGRSRQAQAPFFDLARVEVLRGPQGALFGKNTAAGAINIVSAGPTKTFQAEVNGLYNFDFKGPDVWGWVAGPLTDTLGVRLAFKFLDQDGYIYNRATEQDEPQTKQQVGRLTMAWAPSDNFDFTARVEYANRDIVGGITVSSPINTEQKPGTTRFLQESALGPEGTQNESVIVSGTGNLALGEFTLTSVTGYSWFSANTVNGFDQTIPGGGGTVTNNSVYNSFPERFDQFSQEIRLLSPTGKTLEYIVGAYYDKSNYTLDQLQGFNILNLFGSPYFGRIDSRFNQEAESYSFFGQATVHVSDQLRLIGSLRYTHTHKDGDFASRLVYGPFAIRPISSAVGTIDESNTDPSATIQYDINDRIMVYATYGRGSKSGGFVSNTLGTTNATFTFRPERSRNYEAGIKSTFADGNVVANVSIYNTQFEDLQVSVYQPASSTYLTGNAASATSKGIEGTLSVFPAPNFDITASASYQDIKYDDYPGAACLASQPATCRPATNNLAGVAPAYSSKFTGNLQAHGRFDLSETLRFDATGIVAGRSKFYNSDNQSPVFGIQQGFAKVDLRLQLAAQDNSWHVALVGKNLTNQRTTGSAFNLPAPITAVPRVILYLEPTRNIAIEAGFKF
ncbi:TonB-dependent receptor [Polymorphobacter glacialis]|uniref:TonB-dependent receptor n=2 Tax=Sandarakinorhabdus glacialis TaxID=1614636 RepID=A0A917E5X5_9SPHN|nr:TonB-dependent receptor [Polymorphobacter glacialis]